MNNEQYPSKLPAQEQKQQPGIEKDMKPLPETQNPNYKGSNKLQERMPLLPVVTVELGGLYQ